MRSLQHEDEGSDRPSPRCLEFSKLSITLPRRNVTKLCRTFCARMSANKAVFRIRSGCPALSEWMPLLTAGARLRVVARSLFLLMSKAEVLRVAIGQGAQIELCLLHPETPPEEAAKITELEVDALPEIEDDATQLHV